MQIHGTRLRPWLDSSCRVSKNRLSKSSLTRTPAMTHWYICVQYHPRFDGIYLTGTSHFSSCSSHYFNSIPHLLALSRSCFFTPHSSHHPYTHRFHGALILTVFVVDIAITCCTLQYT
ncbi:hypothetical protein BDR03DRAFT_963534 [Suillus americanus]|nr:hypothetical protein BDR03DRAFT_963534 [Suillus americanus]